jgi:hypothetical protein
MPWQQQRRWNWTKWLERLAPVQTIRRAMLLITRSKQSFVSNVLLSVKNATEGGKRNVRKWPLRRPNGKKKRENVTAYEEERKIV